MTQVGGAPESDQALSWVGTNSGSQTSGSCEREDGVTKVIRSARDEREEDDEARVAHASLSARFMLRTSSLQVYGLSSIDLSVYDMLL
jgi:hypothetical protein